MRYEAGWQRLRGNANNMSSEFFGSHSHSRWCAGLLGVVLAVAAASVPSAAALATDSLPRPAGLEPDISFWRKIFGEVSTDEALVHDNRYLGLADAGGLARERTRDLQDRTRSLLRGREARQAQGMSLRGGRDPAIRVRARESPEMGTSPTRGTLRKRKAESRSARIR
jgi:hypothetical protein